MLLVGIEIWFLKDKELKKYSIKHKVLKQKLLKKLKFKLVNDETSIRYEIYVIKKSKKHI